MLPPKPLKPGAAKPMEPAKYARGCGRQAESCGRDTNSQAIKNPADH